MEDHLHLVPPIAAFVKSSLPPSFELDDLVQAGNLGLLSAATRYRPGAHNGTPFSAYARQRIRGAILDSVKGGRYLAGTMPSIEEETEPAAPSVVEISIDAARRWKDVEAVAVTLPLQLQAVLRARYGRVEATNVECAKVLRFTPEWTSKLHAKALTAMRTGMQRRMLLNPAA